MSSIFLVHGAWMGSWAWERVVSLLRERGHDVLARDLLGYGPGAAAPSTVTREAAITALVDQTVALPAPLTAVGHSMGGTVISELAERIPDRIGRLVYVAAYLLGNGESVITASQSMPEFWTSALGADGAIVPKPDQGGTVVNPDIATAAFMADAAPADQAWAAPLLQLDPFAYGATPLVLSDDRFGRVPRYYIETLDDHAVPIAAQRAMHTAHPALHVHQLDTSHTPMISQPHQLADLIDTIAQA